MRILIVDDNNVGQYLMESYLCPIGDCDVVKDGFSAVDKFKNAFNDKKPYDLICLDIMMPQMSGFEVLEKIRDFEKKNKILGGDSVRIIMVTALDDSESIYRAFKSQCEAYLIKPIGYMKMMKTLEELGIIDDVKKYIKT
jgi:two-component system, chemotaxis family, chemotaxis protein CheY